MAESTLSLKLLIDTQGKRVLFAEAGKDCVDFLFNILSLPVSTLIRLHGKQGMMGSLANLYESTETLNDSYIQPNISKDTLLKPVAPVICGSFKKEPSVKKLYRCSHFPFHNRCNGVSDDPRAVCPNCRQTMIVSTPYVAPPAVEQASGEGGFVKEVVTSFMVMDDLVVTPIMSTVSSITLLNKFNIKEIGSLEEKVVNLGMDEAVKLLKASLQSKNVLTDVFLK